jgi:hypothetical protein
MIFFKICIGILWDLDGEVFYTEQKIKVYSEYTKGTL